MRSRMRSDRPRDFAEEVTEVTTSTCRLPEFATDEESEAFRRELETVRAASQKLTKVETQKVGNLRS